MLTFAQFVRNHSFSLEANWVIAELNLQLSRPLHPGIWKVKFSHMNAVFATTQFAIPPREQLQQKPIGSMHEFLQVHTSVSLPENSVSGSFIKWLHHFSDKVVWDSWTFNDICAEEYSSCADLRRCADTSWSSLSPDPKSAVGVVTENGHLH